MYVYIYILCYNYLLSNFFSGTGDGNLKYYMHVHTYNACKFYNCLSFYCIMYNYTGIESLIVQYNSALQARRQVFVGECFSK